MKGARALIDSDSLRQRARCSKKKKPRLWSFKGESATEGGRGEGGEQNKNKNWKDLR